MQTFCNKVLDQLAYHGVRVWAHLTGPKAVVRYLRNPRPTVTVRLLRAFGAQVGEGTSCKGGLVFDNVTDDQQATGDFRHLSLGANCYLGEGIYFDLAGTVRVGDNAMISARAAVLTHADVNRSPALSRLYPRLTADVTIESDCWIGFGATLMPGVTISRECVVAAGAVVTTSTSPRTVVAGVPARPVKQLPTDHA